MRFRLERDSLIWCGQRSRTAAQREVQRAKVLLAYAQGQSPTQIQRALGVSRPTIFTDGRMARIGIVLAVLCTVFTFD